MNTSIVDQIETDFGTAILSDLTGQHLIRNRQPVRLFDQTRHSSEYFFSSDEQGKPYIQNFAEGKRYYPVTAYCQIYDVDYTTALADLCQAYGITSEISKQSYTPQRKVLATPFTSSPIDFLSVEVYRQCQRHFTQNGLYCYLKEFFNEQTAVDLFIRYRIGTSRRWHYEQTLATCLPQFDITGRLRQVKVIPFHPYTGRRAKAYQDAQRWNRNIRKYESDPNEKVWFAGRSLAGIATPNLQQCYFGEHLLTEYPDKPVALVEGESTAIVCSAIWPQSIWLATGGSTGGKWDQPDRFAVFQNRDVVLWPDSGKFEEWANKVQPLQSLARSIRVNRYVEENQPPGTKNIDLRDLLTWPCYRPKGGKPIYGEVLTVESTDDYPASWDCAR